MGYQLCCLDLTPDGKTLVDTEVAKVSNLWLAHVGNTAKAKQITTKEFAVGRFSWDPSVCGDGRYIVYSAYQDDFATLKWPHFDHYIWPHPNR